MSQDKVKIDLFDVEDINTTYDMKAVIAKLQRELERAIISIEGARDRDMLICGFSDTGENLIKEFSSYTSTVMKEYTSIINNGGQAMTGLKVRPK